MKKTVLITGAASELGRGIAAHLCEAGHRVIASMREPFERNSDAANSLWARGIDVVPLDVVDDSSVIATIQSVRRKVGRIDVLVNNARASMIGAVEAFTPAQVQQVLNTNVVGVVRTTQAVVPAMRRKGGGLIINIGSVVGRGALPFFGIHSAGAFALEALTDSLRHELMPRGVDVVLVQQSISPRSARLLVAGAGEKNTTAAKASRRSDALAQIAAQVEMARAPAPAEVCKALCSLVELPFGSRPYRLLVGEPLGADLLNELAEKLQQAAIEAVKSGTLGTARGS